MTKELFLKELELARQQALCGKYSDARDILEQMKNKYIYDEDIPELTPEMLKNAYRPNVRMTWEQIVDAYPDRWVALKDCDMNGVQIDSAKVCGVCEDKNRLSLEKALVNRNVPFIWRRTTEIEGAFIL